MKSINQATKMIIPNMTLLRKKICDCGEVVEVYEVEIILGPYKGQKRVMKHGCKCEDQALAKQALEGRERARARKVKEVFDKHSLINKELQQANLSNYEPKNKSQAKAFRIAKRYVEVFNPDEPRNILFTGPYGVGKSHLAKGIADEVMGKGYSSIFISAPKLLTRFRSSYDKGTEYSELDLIETINKTGLLILDDLGAEKSNEWGWEKLFEVVDSRQGMHTIYTTNYTPEDLIARLGERNFSRVVNRDTNIVEIQGENHRLATFAKE